MACPNVCPIVITKSNLFVRNIAAIENSSIAQYLTLPALDVYVLEALFSKNTPNYSILL